MERPARRGGTEGSPWRQRGEREGYSKSRDDLLHGFDLVDEAGQVAAADRMLKLAYGLGFDLPHALASHGKNLADLFQRVGVAVGQAVAEFEDFAFAVVELFEHHGNPRLEHALRHVFERIDLAVIFDKLT